MTLNWKEGPLAAVWLPVLNATEKVMGIPTDLLARQCYEESRFNPRAKNAQSGAIGLMQLLPKDFPGAGENPIKDISDGAAYDLTLFKRFNDWQLALAGYDWGPTILAKTIKNLKPHGGIKLVDLPPETQQYVEQIVRDVPVQGILCKTPSLPSLPATGVQPSPSPSAQSSDSSSAKSWFSRATSIFRSPPVPPLESPLAALSPPSVPISSQINQEDNAMSSPNTILVAAAPTLNVILDAIQQFGVDIGPDPEKWKITVLPSLQKLLSEVELQIPAVATAEGGQLQTLLNAKVRDLKTKLALAVQMKPGAIAPAAAAKPVVVV
jgi:hypothetical protein